MKQMRRLLVQVLIACIALTPFSSSAGMIGTQAVIAQPARWDADRVLQLMSRADVQQQLRSLGVDVERAKQRVAALTDDEIRSIMGQVDALPAGGDVEPLLIGILIGIVAAIAYIYWK